MEEKIGLVLGGGGSLGAYEMGAWKALRELGIKFDIVTGTSIGALIGTFVVANKYNEALELWNTITPEKVMKEGININKKTIKFQNLIDKNSKERRFLKLFLKNKTADISPFKELCKQYAPIKEIFTSKIDFGIVCVSYPSFKERHINVKRIPRNLVLSYLHASSACWPIFPKEKILKSVFIDGGFKDTVPIDFALELGATKIIAIDLAGIPKIPQKLFLARLPFVKYIKPHESLGSIMDFSQSVIQRNMALGYNDTLKAYGILGGEKYTLSKESLTDDIGKKFCQCLAGLPLHILKQIDKLLGENDYDLRIKDYFYSFLDLLCTHCGLDSSKIYTFKELISLIDAHFNQYLGDEETIQLFLLKNEKVKTGKEGFDILMSYIKREYLYEGKNDLKLLENISQPFHHLGAIFYQVLIENKLIKRTA
ncbi:MAG: patatin-like phospholipase family protein [Bacillales bacterium]|jgi:predicted acylesterase/phospholipase RssA|nr:patatin-like phospholipase family protein [Bacillales bacterium]